MDVKLLKNKENILKAIMLVLLVFWCGLFLAKKINLANSDIGRHIKNGQLLVLGNEKVRDAVLHKNLYSYTNQEHPFVNHHWGAGVIFYLVWKWTGFIGLSLLYIFMCLIGFLIVFFIAQKETSFYLAYLLSVVAAPLIGLRSEIRPEMFTYVAVPIIFLLLWMYRKGKVDFLWLFAIPFIFLIWVNFNAYFVFGFYLIFLFLVDAFLEMIKSKRKADKKRAEIFKEKSTFLTVIGLVSFIFSLANPWGVRGVFYPFLINSQIGVNVFELASPFSMIFSGELPVGFVNYFLLLLLMLILFTLPLFGVFRKKFSFVVFFWGITLAILSAKQIRNVTFFALFAIPILSMSLYAVNNFFINKVLREWGGIFGKGVLRKFQFNLVFVLIVFAFFFEFAICHSLFIENENWGIGLLEGSGKATEIFISEDMQGPIFNDFDLSSGIIFGLYPDEQIFVDHRPEAYPENFFSDKFYPALESEERWEELQLEYEFNSIFLTNNPLYSKINLFVNKRIQDPSWDLVYKDEFAYLLKRRNFFTLQPSH